jgi:hypothetical protein
MKRLSHVQRRDHLSLGAAVRETEGAGYLPQHDGYGDHSFSDQRHSTCADVEVLVFSGIRCNTGKDGLDTGCRI